MNRKRHKMPFFVLDPDKKKMRPSLLNSYPKKILKQNNKQIKKHEMEERQFI